MQKNDFSPIDCYGEIFERKERKQKTVWPEKENAYKTENNF